MRPCQYRLDCGHVCVLACHPYDPQHKNYNCRKPCTKIICDLGHICPLECFDKCADCKVNVEKKIQSCGHTQEMPCHLEPKLFKCKEPCIKKLGCGHDCGEKCGYDHRCPARVVKSWGCGHSAEVPCSTMMDEQCPEECLTVLACKHKCSGSCQKCSEGRLHEPCVQMCRKSLICGHLCTGTCSTCPPCEFNCENACPHSACANKCSEPCTPCKEKCTWKCSHYRCSKLCSEECDRPPCDEPCRENLPCGHTCIGLCGEPCPSYCRVCQEELNEVLSSKEDNSEARFIHLVDCGHVVEVKTLDKLMEESTVAAGVIERLKKCPWCETTIRKNLRYGNRIKGILRGIEASKKLQSSTVKTRKEKLETEIKKERLKLFERRNEEYDCEASLNFLNRISLHSTRVAQDLPTVLRQLSCLKLVAGLKKKLNMATVHERKVYGTELKVLEKDLDVYTQWLTQLRQSFSDQDSEDAAMEYSRLTFAVFLLTHPQLLEKHGIILSDDLKLKLEEARSFVTQRSRLTSEKTALLANLRWEVEELLPLPRLRISEKERLAIVRAMGLEKGHWFKCKNGHIYAIDDSGTAIVEAKCLECDAYVGGKNHLLRADNSRASEMEGDDKADAAKMEPKATT